MVTLVDEATVPVLTVKLADEEPAGTVTLAGTVAAAVLLLDSVTTTPPEGAAADNVTVPCEVLPPVTDVGLRLTEFKVTVGGGGALAVRLAL